MEGAKKDAEALPPGFRFHPTDEELITYYLTQKISEANFSPKAVADVDLNKCEPWDLPGKAKMGEKEWYFFSLKDRKYPTGVRTNRATSAGYWKTTGKDKEIFNSKPNSELVGMKKTLVFYKGRAPRGEKTNWVMHEYRLHSKPTFKANKDEWVVCRVFMKSPGGKKYSQPRATNPYTIDIALPHPMDPYHHLGIGGRTHQYLTPSELGELARFAKGQPGFNLPIQPQLNNFSGNFSLPGLNLNLGAQQQQPVHRPMPMPMVSQQQQMVAEPMNCVMAPDVGFNGDSCVDLEGYWPTY